MQFAQPVGDVGFNRGRIVGAAGLGLTDFSAARTLSHVTATFEPDAARTTLYREAVGIFRDAYDRLEPWFANRKPTR